jgi:hypothetical protein
LDRGTGHDTKRGHHDPYSSTPAKTPAKNFTQETNQLNLCAIYVIKAEIKVLDLVGKYFPMLIDGAAIKFELNLSQH